MNPLTVLAKLFGFGMDVWRAYRPGPDDRPPLKAAPVPGRTPREEAARQAEFDRGTHRVSAPRGRDVQ